MEFKRRLFTLLGVNLGIIAILSLTLFFIGEDMRKRATDINQLRTEFNSRSQITESLASLRHDADQARVYETDLQNIFPSKDKLVNFSRDLNLIANQNQVSLSSSLGNESQENTTLNKTGFTVTAQGLLPNLINLLKGIRGSNYFVRINSLDLSAQEKNTFKISISGVIFSAL